MNLGFDLDKIFVDYPPFVPDSIIDRLYKKKSNGKLLYRIPSKPEQIFRQITHFPLLRPIITENLTFLKTLVKEKPHKHYLISSRFSFLRNITENLIKTNGLHTIFDDLYFNFEDQQPHLFKNNMIQKLKIHLYVDDDFPLVQYLAQKNPQTLFFWLNKKTNGTMATNIIAITKLPNIKNKIK